MEVPGGGNLDTITKRTNYNVIGIPRSLTGGGLTSATHHQGYTMAEVPEGGDFFEQTATFNKHSIIVEVPEGGNRGSFAEKYARLI